MKIYIAGRFTERERMREIQTSLEFIDHEVVSTWIEEGGGGEQEDAIQDIGDIERCDLLLQVTEVVEGGKGMWVELGYALAKGKAVAVFPRRDPLCVFHALPQVQLVTALDQIQ